MPRAAHRSLGLCPLGLALLLLALVRGEPRSSATDTDGGGGLGGLLRRLMFDLFAWLGSLFGLRGSEVEAHDYPVTRGGGGGDDGRSGRFPPRGAGRRSTTVSPQEVERFPADGLDGVGDGVGARRQPELQEADIDAGANASPAGGIGDASIEQLGGGGGDASPEELAGDRPDIPAPARVTA